MTVKLTYVQRLNLRGILGAWRGWLHTDLRRVWSLMDRLELSEDEKQAIGFEIRVNGPVEQEFWDRNPANPPEPREYDFNSKDVLRIKNALKGFAFTGNDRAWFESLLDVFLPESADE